MSKFDAREYVRKQYSDNGKEKKAVSSKKTNTTGFDARKYASQQRFGFDTFETDLGSVNDLINSTLNTWQSPETMAENRSAVEGMLNRLKSYNSYRETYGDDGLPDLTELTQQYEKALGAWDNRSNAYGKFKSADEFNKKVEELKPKYSEYELQTDVERLSGAINHYYNNWQDSLAYKGLVYDIDFTLNKLDSYKKYAELFGDDVSSFSEIENAFNQTKTDLSELSKYYGKFKNKESFEWEKKMLSDIENLSHEEIAEKLKQSKTGEGRRFYYTTADGDDITWEELYWDTLPEAKDFAEKSQYKSTYKPGTEKFNALTGFYTNTGFGDIKYDYINRNSDAIAIKDLEDTQTGALLAGVDKGEVKQMKDDEIARFNYLYATKGPETAYKYIYYITDELNARERKEREKHWANKAKEAPIATSIFSNIISPMKLIGYIGQWADYAANGKVDQNAAYNRYSHMTSAVRNETSKDMSGTGKFFYNVSMSLGDFLMSTAVTGGQQWASLGLMGTNAAADMVVSAKDRGLSDDQAMILGTVAGSAEVLMEKIGWNKLFDMKTLGKSGFKYLLGNVEAEGFEEVGTDVINFAADFFVAQEKSEWSISIANYMERGLTEKEAISKVITDKLGDFALSGLAGAVSGATLAGGPTIIGTKQHKATGKTIRANGRVEDMLDLTKNMTPEEADAYKLYTKLSDKGITAENITDRQLGALHNQAYYDALRVLDSKKSTETQRESAQNTLRDLTAYSQKSAISKVNAKDFTNDDVNVLIDQALENDENTKSYKLATEYKAKLESGKKLTAKEIQTLVEANDSIFRPEAKSEVEAQLTELGETGDVSKVADAIIREQSGEILTNAEVNLIKNSKYGKYVARGYSTADITKLTEAMDNTDKVMTEEEAKLFEELYDGTVDIEDFRDSFNLATMYAKKDFSQDTILQNKGVLTESQVSAIYSATVMAKVKAQTEKIAKANAKMAKGMTYNGVIDDSIINYTDEVIKGKVRWADLGSRQRQAITFIKGIAKALGMNLTLTNEGMKKDYNGFYVEKGSNTIVLDVNAGLNALTGKGKDSLITTFSHELTHWMKNKASKSYREMDELIFRYLTKASGLTEAELIAKELVNNRNVKNETEARDEIIARACEDLLAMSEEGKRLFNSLSESEQKTLKDKILDLIAKLKDWVADLLNSYKANSQEAKWLRECDDWLNELSKKWDAVLVEAAKGNQALELSGEYGHGEASVANAKTEVEGEDRIDELVSAVNEYFGLAKAEDTEGKKLFQYRAIVEDKDIYREMLLKHKDTIGITENQITELFNVIDKAVDIISKNLEALDYAWDADINDRAFMPVKPNSDSLYKVSLDFSTLCRKRLLQQNIQALLQETLNKQLSKEESIAIRDELLKVQEEGRKIEVACALCYVESARMKSPKQINKFLNNRESLIREFFANRSGGSIKEKIAKAEMKARENLKKANPDGLVGKNGVVLDALTAPKSHMSKADADYIRAEGKKAKASYKLTAQEQAELDAALKMNVDDFTSAKGLENLAKNHRDLFDAYTSFVRNATHSKGIENDTWWRAGDSESIGDNLIAQMNAENGLRSQSWSDFQVIHLLDYIAATIELSTKGAKRQSYTKVPDYVKLLGNTGDMINMSLIPERVFNGKLSYDSVEGMAYEIAKQLRDEYHGTVGTICIGINDAQIRMLLADNTIDMVIPYHHSGMSKETRKLMHIPSWITCEKSQSEKNLTDAEAKARAKEYGVKLDKDSKNYGKSPKFSEWFDLVEARQIAKMENTNPSDAEAKKKYGVMYGGYKAMQHAANNYLKLCAERGLAPKFSNQGVDFTKEANYWKLLTDRKMVDNVTGEIIEQKAIKPIFNEAHILEILNDELARYPQVKADQEYATRKVVGKFLSGEMKLDKSTLEAIQKTVDNVSNVNILESADKQLQSRDSEGNTSPQFQRRTVVEETRDLIAVHNASDSQLLDAIQRGQFIMPSLAVTNKGHTSFGDISVVFRKNTIDPKVDSNNKLYGADAWTPTQTELKKNPKFDERATEKALGNIKNSIGEFSSQLFDVDSNLFKKTIASADGSLYNAYAHNIGMQTAYAMEKGLIPGIPANNGTVNTESLKEELGSVLDKDSEWRAYKKWISGISESIITSYDIATNEDILRTMKAQPDSAKTFRLTEDGKLTAPAAEYKSIDDFRSNKNRLSENAESEADALGQEFLKWAENISQNSNVNFNDVVKAINLAFDNRYNSAEIANAFAKKGIDLSNNDSSSLQALYKQAVELPTPYFEAKPQRSVGINEIAYVILPNNASAELKTSLDENGIKYIEYEKGNDKARLDALNSLEDVKFQRRDYSYNAFAKKPDMKLTVLDNNVPNNRADIINQAKKNAAKVGKVDSKNVVSVFVDDISTDVVIGTDGLKHSLNRGKDLQSHPVSFVTLKIGEILKNSIRINELTPSKESATSAYVLIGAAKSDSGDLYIVRSVVNGYSNEITSIDVLYAVNTKKESAVLDAPRYAAKPLSVTDSAISIADLLDYVNKHFPDILPEDVLKHYGYDARPDGELGEDALYQRRDDTTIHDVVGETERLKAENEKLKADFEALKERLALEKKVTHGTYFNENQIDMVARHLLKTANSTYAKADLVNRLKDVYSYIARNAISKDSKELGITSSYAYGLCHEIATDMLKDKKAEVEVDEYAKGFLRDMKKMRISLNETQKAEAKHRFGDNYHRAFFGKVILAKDGIPLDNAWGELSNLYPDVFNAETNDADQVGALFDGIAAMREASEILVEYNAEEEARWLTVEIFNKFWTVSAIETTADKYDKRIRQLNLEHRKRIAELRDAYNERLKAQHKFDKAKFVELASKIRADRDTKVAEAKKHGREKLAQYRENAERKTRIQRITQNSLTLNEWLVKNSKDKHIHESLKGPVITLLNAIDFSSKRMLEKSEPTKRDISLSKALSKVQMMMVKASEGHEELVELYGHGLDEDIENMIKSVDAIVETIGEKEFTLNRMTLADLETLDKMVRTIKSAVTKMNKFHTINHAKGIAHLSQESMEYLDSLGKAKVYDGLKGSTQKLLEWNNALPYYAFKRYGSGGMKVYEALQDGWDKFSFNIKEIIDYSNRVYTSKEVNEWSESVKSFRILLPATDYDLKNPKYKPQYQEVKMTVSQMMSLYCLQKREQAKGHLLGGGMRVADFKDSKGKIISQSEGVVLTQKDIDNIIGSLTDRQKAVADRLQEFMNDTCSEWGNDVSMLRFGYKAFGEENYFPIQSDKNNLAVDDETDQVNSLFRLLNMSFTKSISENANNRVVISDVFDVFAQHTSDMAKYNALALPVLDAFKWYNYTEKQELSGGAFKTMGVKQSLESAFGKSGQSYFTTFLKDINGQQEVGRDTIGNHIFTNAKIAAVGANLRVMLLQPTSYVRASAIIDNRYLIKALAHSPKIKKAEEHCGIALWKSMGYYDTNIQKGVEEQIKHNDTFKDKAVSASMKGAEVADKVTWGYLWNACELEIRDKRKDLKVGSKEFYEAIGKRLREIIYATQVVDSTMTRSQMMRSNKTYDKMLTAFASEPTLAYNMLQDAYMTTKLDARRFGKKAAMKKNAKRAARVLYAYTLTNVLAALIESGFDAWRDDDDEEKDLAYFMNLYLSNFLSDMSITAKIPYVKELHSVIKGFGTSRTDTQWMDSMVNAFKGWSKILSGEGDPSKTAKNTLKAISDLSGLPFYNLYREIISVTSNLELFTADDLNELFD